MSDEKRVSATAPTGTDEDALIEAEEMPKLPEVQDQPISEVPSPEYRVLHMLCEDQERIIKELRAAAPAVAQEPHNGAWRWIDDAVKMLKAVDFDGHRGVECNDVDGMAWADRRDELLSGVPCPQVDLGFDSPADRAARKRSMEAMATGWVSVKDRLPSDGQEVRFQVGSGAVFNGWFAAEVDSPEVDGRSGISTGKRMTFKNHFLSGDFSIKQWNRSYTYGVVIQWMPLPAAPCSDGRNISRPEGK